MPQVDKNTHWGDLESEEEESEEEEEEEEEQAEVDIESLADGLTSVVSGYSSLPSGIETPEVLDLRKGKAGGGAPLCTAEARLHAAQRPVHAGLAFELAISLRPG